MKIAVLTLLSAILLSPNHIDGCLQLDLIIIADLSGSVRGNEGFISEAVLGVIETSEIDDNFRIGVITFNDSPTSINDLSSDKQSLIRSAIVIRTLSPQGSTFMSKALQAALNQFVNNGIIGHRKMIILITDGMVDDRHDTNQSIIKLGQLGVMVCGVMVNDGSSNPEFFKSNCGECYVESRYENLVEQIKRLDLCL